MGEPRSFNWHDQDCPRPDFYPFGEGLLSCLRCGSTGEDSAVLPSLESESAIRLLWLLPGSFDDEVHCRIHTAPLASRPQFDAISYTWADETGNDDKCSTVFLDDRPFRVTSNCKTALRRVRQRWFKVHVWIDAICIDQNSNEEKGHQVKLMPDIYSSAGQVFLYAGEHDAASRRIFRTMENIVNYTVTRPVSSLANVDLESDWLTFMKRPYFNRLWVIQEIALARNPTMICGNNSASWSTVEIYCAAAIGSSSHEKQRIFNFNHELYTRPDTELMLLDNSRKSISRDPRDKVYGILGLLPNRRLGCIEADYTTSVGQLYHKLAVQLAKTHGWHNVLLRAGLKQQSIPSVPSWIPDWSYSGEMKKSRIGPSTMPLAVEDTSVGYETVHLKLLQFPDTKSSWMMRNQDSSWLSFYIWIPHSSILSRYLKSSEDAVRPSDKDLSIPQSQAEQDSSGDKIELSRDVHLFLEPHPNPLRSSTMVLREAKLIGALEEGSGLAGHLISLEKTLAKFPLFIDEVALCMRDWMTSEDWEEWFPDWSSLPATTLQTLQSFLETETRRTGSDVKTKQWDAVESLFECRSTGLFEPDLFAVNNAFWRLLIRRYGSQEKIVEIG